MNAPAALGEPVRVTGIAQRVRDRLVVRARLAGQARRELVLAGVLAGDLVAPLHGAPFRHARR